MAIRSIILGLVFNAAHASHRSPTAPELHAPTSRHPDIRLRANKANNTLSVVYSGFGMNEQGLADIVTASLVVRKVTVTTKDSNGCQYKGESMENGIFLFIKDENAEELHRGTEIMLSLHENQLEYLEEEVIKDLVKKECGSIGYPIYLKVEKEPELNDGGIQEVAEEWQVIHEPKKPIWKRIGKWMIDRLCTCVITHGALAAVGALESALDGDEDAFTF